MNLLIVNCSSNQLKYNLFNTFDDSKNAEGTIKNIGSKQAEHIYITGTKQQKLKQVIVDLTQALSAMVNQLTDKDKGVIENINELQLSQRLPYSHKEKGKIEQKSNSGTLYA